jgi:lipopolysaccharide transport system permease protein
MISKKIKQTVLITSEPDSTQEYLQKIWSQRNLILSIAKRDLKTKYTQTVLGLGWTILQPLTAILIFSTFFSLILPIDTSPLPYPIFAFIGFSAWNLWIQIFTQGAQVVFDNNHLVRKVYFAKMILPISKVLTASFDFMITLILLGVVFLIFDISISWKVAMLPFVFLLHILLSFSAAIILFAVSLKKRDLLHIIPYISNFGIWLTPVFYPRHLFPEQWRFLFNYNPLSGIVEAYRWCLSENYSLEINNVLIFLIIPLLFAAGVMLFKKNEDFIADYL